MSLGSNRKNQFMYAAIVAAAGLWFAADQQLALDRSPGSHAIQIGLLGIVVFLIAIGADRLVDASRNIALKLGISPLVIGLTIVAIGTSAPEMAASLMAGFDGNGDIAIGNVIGSSLFNLCFILGGVAVVTRLGVPISRALLWRDTLIMAAAAIVVGVFVADRDAMAGLHAIPTGLLFNRTLDFTEGVILLAGLVGYLAVLYMRRKEKGADDETPSAERPMMVEVARLGVGLLLVLIGCQLLVGQAEPVAGGYAGYGALWLARTWEVPDYIVGVTIVAAGTSAPELVVSLVAALRKSLDISVGNLIGSCTFNTLGVLGLAGILVQPPVAPRITVGPDITISLMMLALLLIVLLLLFVTGRRIARWEGLLLILLGIGFWIFDFTR